MNVSLKIVTVNLIKENVVNYCDFNTQCYGAARSPPKEIKLKYFVNTGTCSREGRVWKM